LFVFFSKGFFAVLLAIHQQGNVKIMMWNIMQFLKGTLELGTHGPGIQSQLLGRLKLRRIEVPIQSGQTVLETPSPK
jgi:hypothetical protein